MFTQIKQRLPKPHSIYISLVLVMFGVLLPLVLLLIWSSSYSIRMIRQQVSASYQNQTAFYTGLTDQGLSDISLYLSNISVNNTDFEILQTSTSENDNYKLAQISLLQKMHQDLALYPLVDFLFYYDAGPDLYSTAASSGSTYEQKTAIQHHIQQAAASKYAEPHPCFSSWETERLEDDVVLIRVLPSGDGFIGACVSMNRLLSSFLNTGLAEQVEAAYIDGESSLLVTSSDLIPADIDFASAADTSTMQLSSGTFTVTGEYADSGSFALLAFIPDQLILSRLPVLSIFFRTLSLLLLVLIPVSVLLLRRIFRKPFETMITSIERIHAGDLDERIQAESLPLEFRSVSVIFNRMMDRIQGLKIQIYEEKIRRQEDELNYLQMQVKPHFYLNSLNMIYTLTRNHKTELVSELTMCLIRYFRYIFRQNTSVTVAQELAHIRDYLQIQKLRYAGKFDYEISCENRWSSCTIPYLLIQNFAENTIKYALTNDEPTFLLIEAAASPDSSEDDVHQFCIHIEDNGPGFPDTVLRGEPSTLPEASAQERRHLGVSSSQRMLELIYHGEASLHLYNLTPHGAAVDILLPIRNNPPETES